MTAKLRKTCQQCGTEFVTGKPNRRYCSHDCRENAKERRRLAGVYGKCLQCGKTFRLRNWPHLHCSKKCARRHLASSPGHRAKRKARYTSKVYRAKRNAQIRARRRADPVYRAKQRERNAKYHARKRAEKPADYYPRPAQCEQCGGDFEARSGTHRFCSPNCRPSKSQEARERATARQRKRYAEDPEYRANQLAEKSLREGMRAAIGL